MADIARITEVIEPEVKALGFDLVRVRIFKGGEIGSINGEDEEQTLQIMAERPDTGQLVLDDCAALSHRISDVIDALEEAGEILIHDAYRLEVSSPGIDRPLTRLKDFETYEGYEGRLELDRLAEGRKRFRGILAGVEGDNIAIDLEGEEETTLIPFAWIVEAKLVLTDDLMKRGAEERAQRLEQHQDNEASE